MDLVCSTRCKQHDARGGVWGFVRGRGGMAALSPPFRGQRPKWSSRPTCRRLLSQSAVINMTQKPYIENRYPPPGATSAPKSTKTPTPRRSRKALSTYTYCTRTHAVAWPHRLGKKSCCEGSRGGSHGLLHHGIRHSIATPLPPTSPSTLATPFPLIAFSLPENLFPARMMEVDSDPTPQGYNNDDGLTNGLTTSRYTTAL